MTPLALSCLAQGKVVVGVDKVRGDNCILLEEKGAKIVYTHSKDNVKGASLVVYSLATENCPEVQFAQEMGIECVARQVFLARQFDFFPHKIAICGTHGKTTATLLLSHALKNLGIQNVCFAGAVVNNDNYQVSCVVAEGCEYKESFLSLHPDDVICLNVEYDHPDFFDSLEDVKRSFQKFFSQSKKVYTLFESDAKNTFNLSEKYSYQVKAGSELFLEIFKKGKSVLKIDCPLPFWASQDVFAVACYLLEKGFFPQEIEKSLQGFGGIARRWQTVDTKWGKVVVDYAHHPTQIEKALISARQMGEKRLFIFFQPHTYTRTNALFDQFCSVLSQSPFVGILPTFGARETSLPKWGNLDEKLTKQIAQKTKACLFENFEKVKDFIKSNCQKQDLILLLGAGDVDKIANLLQ